MSKDKLPFGRRYGFENVALKIQIDSIDNELKTDLYNSFLIYIYDKIKKAGSHREAIFEAQHKLIWVHYLRIALDKFPTYDYQFKNHIYQYLYNQPWFKTYEFFEFLINSLDKRLYNIDEFIEYVNHMLERNNSGYRIVDNNFVPITNTKELEEIEKARENAKATGILGLGEHLSAAISLLSKKPTPDLRNSIKESISMVEAVCRTIEPSQNTLGKALNKIETKGKLNATLKASFEKIYAYTNDKGGIRHALMDESSLDVEDARYFLIACSAFSNYLIDKGRKEGLIKIDKENKEDIR